MKNNILFALLVSSVLMFSCGTMSRTAQSSPSGFSNSIYYTPDQKVLSAQRESEEELSQLRNETSRYLDRRSENINYTSKGATQTIFVGDTNVVDIDYNPNYTYSIMDDDESYEARLRKFDSPVYTINIEWNDPYYSDWDFWYRPYWATAGTAWYNPWWGGYYSWYGPSWGWHSWHGHHWHNPWYCGGWYDPWYGGFGWYDPWWGPSWGHPHYGPGWAPAPFPPHHQPHRDVYYGRRESGPSYNPTMQQGSGNIRRGSSYTRRDPNISQIRGNSNTKGTSVSNSASATGNSGRSSSAYRRGGNSIYNGAVYNNAAANAGNRQNGQTVRPGNSNSSSQPSMYRRSSTKNTRSSASTSTSSNREQYQNSNRSSSANGSYSRSSSSNYNRSSSSSYGSGSSSTRSSSSSSSSSQSSGRSGGGSSYRR
ncbi:MAG: hypothetical protein IJA38_05765 [Bacteroidales bacterium]|nr:hypothetical protein [Bacteroidales bacterium]